MDNALIRITHAVDTIDRAFDSLITARDAHPFLRQAIGDFVGEGREHLELIRTLCRQEDSGRDGPGDPAVKRKTG